MASGSNLILEEEEVVANHSMEEGKRQGRSNKTFIEQNVRIANYEGETQMQSIMDLIDGELSEPYTVYTYRYFLNQWPQLCFLAHYISPSTSPPSNAVGLDEELHKTQENPIGVVIGKLDKHLKGKMLMRGYIGMISIRKDFRGKGIASELLRTILEKMILEGAQEIVLETEIDNEASLRLYERFGFIREKRLFNFYLNGKDCFRLICEIPKSFWQRPLTPPLPFPTTTRKEHPPQYPSNSFGSIHDPNYSFSQMRIAPTTTSTLSSHSPPQPHPSTQQRTFSQFDIL